MARRDVVDMRARRIAASAIARDNYSSSLMSNAKWRILFEALEKAGIEAVCAAKFVTDEEERSPLFPDLYPHYAYIDLWNVYPLVEIEWIEFRRSFKRKQWNNLPAQTITQDIDAIRRAIEGTGKRFPLVVSEEAIRVVGHVR